MRNLILVTTALAMTVGSAGIAESAQRATKEHKQRVGVLSCEVSGGVGMIFGSNKAVNCTFKQQGGKVERYTGKIGKLGIDIGVTKKTYLSWVVVNTSPSRVGDGALAGTYVGASAGASAGLGLGANALVGGNAKNFALQPLSAETGTGLNVAAGVSRLQLATAPAKRKS